MKGLQDIVGVNDRATRLAISAVAARQEYNERIRQLREAAAKVQAELEREKKAA